MHATSIVFIEGYINYGYYPLTQLEPNTKLKCYGLIYKILYTCHTLIQPN
jgi:hypothetical protein